MPDVRTSKFSVGDRVLISIAEPSRWTSNAVSAFDGKTGRVHDVVPNYEPFWPRSGKMVTGYLVDLDEPVAVDPREPLRLTSAFHLTDDDLVGSGVRS